MPEEDRFGEKLLGGSASRPAGGDRLESDLIGLEVA